ncbi:MAG: hypothetical protein AB7F86_15380 [Bdellovibrionales bacterium]
MNWLQLLEDVQNWRAELSAWGIDYPVLLGIGGLALVLFLMSMREIVVWYLRIYKMQSQLDRLCQQVDGLRQSLDQANSILQSQGFGEIRPAEPEASPAEKAKSKKFSLDH